MIAHWWHTLVRREKLMVAGSVIIVIFTAAYLLLEPVIHERQTLAADIPRLREDAAWMKAHVNQVLALHNENFSVTGKDTAVLTPAIVENALLRSGLLDKVSDMRPETGQSVKLTFDEVPFNSLMVLLFDLKMNNGAKVKLAKIDSLQDKIGMVKASLTLVADQSR